MIYISSVSTRDFNITGAWFPMLMMMTLIMIKMKNWMTR